MTASRAQAVVLALAAVVMLPLAVFASKGVAPLQAVAALVLVGIRYGMTRTLPHPPVRLVWLFALLLAWCMAGALWAVDPRQTLLKVGQLLGTVIAGLVLLEAALSLDGDGRAILRRGLLAGALAAVVVLGFEVVTDAVITRAVHGITPESQADWRTEKNYFSFIKNSAALTALMVWPVAVALMSGRQGAWSWTIALVFAGGLALVAGAGAHTAGAALVAGFVVFALARWLPRLVAALIAGTLVVTLAAAPLLPPLLPRDQQQVAAHLPSFVPTSIHHRILIWQFVAKRIAERPLLGWGLDSARSLPGGAEKVHILVDYPDGRRLDVTQETLPLHPHNTLLQWWLELGVPGVVMAGALVVVTVRRTPLVLARRDERAAALALLVTVLLIANSSYGAFQNWWLGGVWLAVAFLAGAAEASEDALVGAGGHERHAEERVVG
ncbi:MAG: O-antigen ligase family protein [Alphaproteobacteria bacterium]